MKFSEKGAGGGVKGRSEIFRKFIRIRGDGLPLLLTVALKRMFRYLTAPATSTAVERLFSAAGLILDARRSKLDPSWVDHILFLREAFLLGTCKLEWE